jgi:CRP/FNR family cyclic AMP-dependent transcriptional regulator
MATQTAAIPHDPLKGIPLFSEFGDAEREDLRRLLQPRNFDAQRAVFWIGEPGDEFYIIEGGQVVICYPDEGGREVTLAVLGPGQFFGELSLLDGGRRTATARAQGDVRLLALGREQFHQFLRRHPSSAVHVLEVLGRRQRDNLDKLRGIKNANEAVEERQTPVQRVVERVARVFASEVFLVANLVFFVTWIVIQTVRYNDARAKDPSLPPVTFLDQPPTFFWLGFMVTIEAIILSVFVLNYQRRQAQRDAIKADLDYQVNRKAQLEIMQLHEKLDRLQATLAADAAARGAAAAGPPSGNGADS